MLPLPTRLIVPLERPYIWAIVAPNRYVSYCVCWHTCISNALTVLAALGVSSRPGRRWLVQSYIYEGRKAF